MDKMRLIVLLTLLGIYNVNAADSNLDSLKDEKAAKQNDDPLQQSATIKKNQKKKNVVYQWVDENGNTVISDKPHPGAIEIKLPEPQTYTPSRNTLAETAKDDEKPREFKQVKIYDKTPPKLKIIAPVNDGWLENNMGNVEIIVNVNPYLRMGQQLVIKLDDAEVSRGSLARVSIKGVDRGSHQILVEVVMENTGKVIASKESAFHARRPTVNR